MISAVGITLPMSPNVTSEGITNSTCVIIGTNNATFCGVYQTWEPRKWIEQAPFSILPTVIVPTSFAGLIYGITICYMAVKFKKCYKTFLDKNENIPCDTDFLGLGQKMLGSVTNKKVALRWSYILFWFVMPVGYMIYDTIDVALDSFYFHRLEQQNGTLMNNFIMRDENVNNAILAFAYLGAFKSIIVVIFTKMSISCLEDYTEQLSTSSELNKKLLHGSRDEVTLTFKSAIPFTTLLFEDAVELVLEYFYADKYAAAGSDRLVLINSTLMAIVSSAFFVVTARKMVEKLRDMSGENVFYLGFNAPSFLLGISKLLRVYSCWYHSYEGGVLKECLMVSPDGTLIQTPFKEGCHNIVDRIILICAAVSAVGAIVLAVCSAIGYVCEKNKYEWVDRRSEIVGEATGAPQRSRNSIELSAI